MVTKEVGGIGVDPEAGSGIEVGAVIATVLGVGSGGGQEAMTGQKDTGGSASGHRNVRSAANKLKF